MNELRCLQVAALSTNGLHQQLTPDPFDTTHAQKVLQSTPAMNGSTQAQPTTPNIEWGSGPRPSTINSTGRSATTDCSPNSNSVFDSVSPLVHSNSFGLNQALAASPRSAVDWPLSATEPLQPVSLNGGAANDFKPKQDFGSPKVVSTLDDAFSKLVNLDSLVGGNKTQNGGAVFPNKNPFGHIKNPPRPPMNAMMGGGGGGGGAREGASLFSSPQSAPPLPTSYSSIAGNPFLSSLPYVPPRSAGLLPQPQMVGGNNKDPFNDDFFN